MMQEHGVANSDGDGTVPIISTGVMCYKGWRGPKLNPGGMRIVSREYIHQPSRDFRDLRCIVMLRAGGQGWCAQC